MELNHSQQQNIRNRANKWAFNENLKLTFTSADIREAAAKFNEYDPDLIAKELIKTKTSQLAPTTSQTKSQETQMINTPQQPANTLATINQAEHQITKTSNALGFPLTKVDTQIVLKIANQSGGINFDETQEYVEMQVFGYVSQFLENKKEYLQQHLLEQATRLRQKLANQTNSIQNQTMQDIVSIVEEDNDRVKEWAASIGNAFKI